MFFWAAVITGGGFAWMGIKKGFLPMWAICFNVLAATYLSVMTLPIFAVVVPDDGGQTYIYNCIICMLIAWLLIFAVLQIIASSYFSAGFMVTFPKLFDSVVSAILGFVSGYVVCCMLVVIVSLLPVTSYHPLAEDFLGPMSQPPAVRRAVTGACNLMGTVSLQMRPKAAKEILGDFVKVRQERLDRSRETQRPPGR